MKQIQIETFKEISTLNNVKYSPDGTNYMTGTERD